MESDLQSFLGTIKQLCSEPDNEKREKISTGFLELVTGGKFVDILDQVFSPQNVVLVDNGTRGSASAADRDSFAAGGVRACEHEATGLRRGRATAVQGAPAGLQPDRLCGHEGSALSEPQDGDHQGRQ